MIRSDYLDLAVGLTVVLFLGGLVISGLNEGLNWLGRVRAKFLWAYLYDLFDDRTTRALPRGLLGITTLWKPGNDRRPQAGGNPTTVGGGIVPSSDWLKLLAYALDPVDAPELLTKPDGVRTTIKHVPPVSLAQAMLEVFANVGRQQVTSSIDVIAGANAEPAAVDDAVATLVRRLELEPDVDVRAAVGAFRDALARSAEGDADARNVAADALTTALGSGTPDTVFRDAWRELAAEWGAVREETVVAAFDATARAFPAQFARVRIDAALSKLDAAAPLAPTLRRLWEGAAGRIDEFRTDLERCLDAELKRLSGYYRRSIRIVMLGLALLFAIGGGLDAIAVVRDLWRNPDTRAALVQRADELASSEASSTAPDTTESPSPAAPAGALERIQQECRDAHPPDDAEIDSVSDAAEAYGKVRTCVTDALDELTGTAVLDHALWVDAGAWGRAWTSEPFVHAVGTALAALGLMLGAPFWFDVLKRITGVRQGLVGDT